MGHLISFFKILFLRSIVYQTCVTDNQGDCRYQDFSNFGSSSTLARCGLNPKNLFMGPYGQKTKVIKTMNIHPNKQLEFSIGIWIFDSWDVGEGLYIYANDIQLDKISFSSCAEITSGTIYLTLFINITIRLQDNLDSDLQDESWGFRDFIIRLSIPCVNFYSECNYTGILCQGEQSKKTNRIPFEIKSILFGPSIIVKIKDPNYFEGVLQEFNSIQPCLNGYKFPKYILPS
ncbi:unnamed protein product [Paramecium pentaurelia]|uniref:Uncharacterized protein n=1 Tax=Paramecium pentaurelia TaxID=43138 RepID=A0A8S1TL62_9CILI|nr:unnamed protein product [Paramecium pentaurelia]